MEHKHFSCPQCSSRFRKRHLFTIKLICRECGGKFKYKTNLKQALLCSFPPSLTLFITYSIFYHYGYDYWAIIFGALAFLLVGLILAVYIYRNAKFETYYLP